MTDEDDNDDVKIVDCNGTELNDGDAVTLIKDLKVKGAGQTLKRGTLIKNIRTNAYKPEEIDCSTKQIKGLVLKTCFVKKA
jgi:protein PhnA